MRRVNRGALWRHRFAKLRSLSAGEFLDMLRAQGALLHAQALVWVRPTGTLIGESAASLEQPVANKATMELAERLGLAVSRAAENGVFRPLCLVRALALQRLLQKHGIGGSHICVGVAQRRGQFVAHAWVQYGESVLGDAESNVRRYAQLPALDFTALQ